MKPKPTSGLREALRIQGRSQTWLASHLEVTDATVSSWCGGKSSPSIKTMVTISLLTGVPIYDLFFKDEYERQLAALEEE
jgi:DNA-binding XRE family transcriptional regulator